MIETLIACGFLVCAVGMCLILSQKPKKYDTSIKRIKR